MKRDIAYFDNTGGECREIVEIFKDAHDNPEQYLERVEAAYPDVFLVYFKESSEFRDLGRRAGMALIDSGYAIAGFHTHKNNTSDDNRVSHFSVVKIETDEDNE